MKIYNYITVVFLTLIGLVSCETREVLNGENNLNDSSDLGVLNVLVEAEEPIVTKAPVSTANFPIKIVGKVGTATEAESYEYDNVSKFPADGLRLPIGKYVVSANSNLTLEREMPQAYYAGEKETEILTGIKTKVVVDCLMQNTKIQIVLSKEFEDLLSEWVLTIHEGEDNSITFSSKDSKRLTFWLLGDGVKELKMDIRGKLKADGNTITDQMILTKSQSSTSYDDDTDEFQGGEFLKISLVPSATEDGDVSFGVTADIFSSESKESSATIDVTPIEQGGDEPDTDDPGIDNPTTDGPVINFSPESILSYSLKDADKPLAAANILASKGLKSLIVRIVPGNAGFANALTMTDRLGLTFTAEDGVDIMANSTNFNALFENIGMPQVKAPVGGATEYEFAIYAFYEFINPSGPTDAGKAHEFYITVEDNEGNISDSVLKLTITE